MNKNFFILIILIILISIGVIILKSNNIKEETVKIGALLYLTGSGAEWGENSLNGINLAIKEINERGGLLGKKIELIIEDSNEDNVSNVITGYQALKRKGVKFMVGPSWTPAGLALYPIASKDDVVLISPSLGVAEFNEAGDNLFNTWPHDVNATKYLAQHVYNSGIRSVALFSSQQPWEKMQGDAFEEEFKRLGGVILIKLESHAELKEFKTEVAKIFATKPEAVIFTNYTNMGIAAKSLKEIGYINKKFAILMDEGRVEIASGGLENTVYVQNIPPTKDFINSFEREYGKKPRVSADTAYDAIYWLANAIIDSKSLEVKEIKNQMNSYSEMNRASGYMKTDGKGGVLKDYALYIVKNDKLEIYEQ
jgi:branched-chain amino acid transport system substrate-binding protein